MKPLRIGDLVIPNRVIMSPLTRSRADNLGRVPTAMMREYYMQRASAGLIITEATCVSPQGIGYAHTPGIWSAEQVAGWSSVTEGVHAAGGRIFLQLWHVGRISDPLFLNGELPVAPSAIRPEGYVSLVRPKKPFVTPRALETSELAGVIESYKKAAQNAKEAGFDGVEIHGANGYLLDQFLQDRTNHRTDSYGGSVENRARLMLEVTDACISVWGPDRVGMHLAPKSDSHDMGDSNPLATFGYVAKELAKRKIAFICARENSLATSGRIGPEIKRQFGGIYIANEKYTRESAEQALLRGEADAIAFGIPFLANPDLPIRFAENKALNPPQIEGFYSQTASGYIDYPTEPRPNFRD